MWFFAVVIAVALCVPSSDAEIARVKIPEEATDWRSDFFRKNSNISLESLIPIRTEEDESLYNFDLYDHEDDSPLLKAVWPGGLLNWPENSEGWPEVPYRIRDILLPGGIKDALKHWEEHTCIKFRETTGGLFPHVVFREDPNSCFSRIGRIFFLFLGQSILLTTACQTEVGTVIHEIGHALGLYHEQTRKGRNEYVQIRWTNMRLNNLYNNFPAITENYGVPYDYSSIMHYGMLDFSKNGGTVLVSTNQMAQGLLFLNEELSHMDKRLVNIQYGCIDKWMAGCSLSRDPCENDGYLGADCSCVCPAGTSGDQCQNKDMDYTEALIAKYLPYNAEITTETTITSPNYPTPVQEGTTYTVRITAPEGKKVSLKFSDFDISPRCGLSRLSNFCCTDGLEMRLDGQPASGTWYCGTEIAPGQEFVSQNNVLVFVFHTYNYKKYFFSTTYRGYEAAVTFV